MTLNVIDPFSSVSSVHSAWDDVAIKKDPSVLCQCGKDYEPKEPRRAAFWYKEAIDAGSTEAAVCLGLMCRDGRGVAKDEREAVRLFQMAADKGDPDGMAYLGEAYNYGLGGVEKDKQKSLELFQKSATGGSAEGKALLGWRYHMDQRDINDPDSRVAPLLKESSMSGNARGKYFLGLLCWFVQDDNQAEQLLKEAAALGDSDAMRWLGNVLRDKDLRQAITWFKRAGERGDITALAAAGRILVGRREATKEEISEGFQLFKKAFELGSTKVFDEMEEMFTDGWGCSKDHREAHKFRLLSRQV